MALGMRLRSRASLGACCVHHSFAHLTSCHYVSLKILDSLAFHDATGCRRYCKELACSGFPQEHNKFKIRKGHVLLEDLWTWATRFDKKTTYSNGSYLNHNNCAAFALGAIKEVERLAALPPARARAAPPKSAAADLESGPAAGPAALAGAETFDIVFAVIKLDLKTFENTTITLDVEFSDTIAKVKQKICDKERYPPDKQILLMGGSILQNERTLADHNIQKGTPELRLVVKRDRASSAAESDSAGSAAAADAKTEKTEPKAPPNASPKSAAAADAKKQKTEPKAPPSASPKSAANKAAGLAEAGAVIAEWQYSTKKSAGKCHFELVEFLRGKLPGGSISIKNRRRFQRGDCVTVQPRLDDAQGAAAGKLFEVLAVLRKVTPTKAQRLAIINDLSAKRCAKNFEVCLLSKLAAADDETVKALSVKCRCARAFSFPLVAFAV